MRKLNCRLCDGCRVVLSDGFCRVVRRTSKTPLDFCRPCYDEYALRMLSRKWGRIAGVVSK